MSQVIWCDFAKLQKTLSIVSDLSYEAEACLNVI
jgi:hypothetical protein